RTIEVVRADRARLALEAAGLHDDPNLAYDKARRALADTGQLLSRQEWQAFLEGTGSATMTAPLGEFLEVPGEYLAGADDSATAKVETQLRFARTMRDVGVTRLAARSLDELGSDEIKAVEEAIREFIDEEE
ncbi:TPA: XRE family transcriptional regulator, partial [Enterococcus faecium]|nr:XRE family transcriptional regulator [Enterococcus faecium]